MSGTEQAENPPAAAGRIDEILRAACRVVVSGGASDLRIGTVAQEAGMSRTLVHYYFTTRQELHARGVRLRGEPPDRGARSRARDAGDRSRSAPSVRSCEPSIQSSRRRRHCGTRCGRASATTRSAAARPGALPRLGGADRAPAGGRPRGRIGAVASVNPEGAGWRLAAAADGLDSILYLGLLDRDEARVLARLLRHPRASSDEASLAVRRPRAREQGLDDVAAVDDMWLEIGSGGILLAARSTGCGKRRPCG